MSHRRACCCGGHGACWYLASKCACSDDAGSDVYVLCSLVNDHPDGAAGIVFQIDPDYCYQVNTSFPTVTELPVNSIEITAFDAEFANCNACCTPAPTGCPSQVVFDLFYPTAVAFEASGIGPITWDGCGSVLGFSDCVIPAWNADGVMIAGYSGFGAYYTTNDFGGSYVVQENPVEYLPPHCCDFFTGEIAALGGVHFTSLQCRRLTIGGDQVDTWHASVQFGLYCECSAYPQNDRLTTSVRFEYYRIQTGPSSMKGRYEFLQASLNPQPGYPSSLTIGEAEAGTFTVS